MKIVCGKPRKSVEIPKNDVFGAVLFVLGAISMCVMLLVCEPERAENVKNDNAVAVMSSAVNVSEELAEIEKPVFSPEESFFDSLGKFFAELIFGDK